MEDLSKKRKREEEEEDALRKRRRETIEEKTEVFLFNSCYKTKLWTYDYFIDLLFFFYFFFFNTSPKDSE